MVPNLLSTVRAQFATRRYGVDEIHRDDHDRWWTFTITTDPSGTPLGVEITFLASPDNPDGTQWVPSDIHWGTNVTTYQGALETSPVHLADVIIATIEADNA